MITYLVSVAGPKPAWIRWNPDTNLPCVTFDRPDGISLSDAMALKARADICCGGTLNVVAVAEALPAPVADAASAAHGIHAGFQHLQQGDPRRRR